MESEVVTTKRAELSERLIRLGYRLAHEGSIVEDIIMEMEELPTSIHGFAQERSLNELQTILYRYSRVIEKGLMGDDEFRVHLGEAKVVEAHG